MRETKKYTYGKPSQTLRIPKSEAAKGMLDDIGIRGWGLGVPMKPGTKMRNRSRGARRYLGSEAFVSASPSSRNLQIRHAIFTAQRYWRPMFSLNCRVGPALRCHSSVSATSCTGCTQCSRSVSTSRRISSIVLFHRFSFAWKLRILVTATDNPWIRMRNCQNEATGGFSLLSRRELCR